MIIPGSSQAKSDNHNRSAVKDLRCSAFLPHFAFAAHPSRFRVSPFLSLYQIANASILSPLFDRPPREISLARALVPLARDWIVYRRHAARSVVTIVVARPRPPVHGVYDLWLPHSGESVAFARERASITKSRAALPDRVPLCGTTAARILEARAFSANCGRLGLEIRFTIICNLSAVWINFNRPTA